MKSCRFRMVRRFAQLSTSFITFDSAMEEASQSNDEWHKLFDNSSWVVSRHNNAAKEPYICSLMQNILLSSQGIDSILALITRSSLR